MDTWAGNSSDPVTLHKYLYANGDAANWVDPTGNFSLISLSTSMSIRSEMTTMQMTVGFSLLDAAFNPDMTAGDFAANAANGFVLGRAIAMMGRSGFKLLRMLSGKFRRACDAGNSFTANTMVFTEDGLRPISDIKIGDKVWAYGETSGENRLQAVIHLIQGDGEKNLVDITLENWEVISATAGHPMYSQTIGGWIDASKLTLDDQLLGLAGSPVGITDIQKYLIEAKVFNLTVANFSTYYVGVDKVLVHNTGVCNAGKFLGELSSGGLRVMTHSSRKGHPKEEILFKDRSDAMNWAGGRGRSITLPASQL